MTIPASTVPAALLALYNGIVAQVNDPSVVIQYGEPGTSQPQDIIAIGLTIDKESVPYQMVASGAAGWIDETYTVEITIDVFQGGDDPRTVFERACTLEYAIDQFVRGDPSLGGVVTIAWPAGCEYQQSPEERHKGRRVVAMKRITCRART